MASSEPQRDVTSLLHPDPYDDVFGPTDLDAELLFGPLDDIDEIERPSQAAAPRAAPKLPLLIRAVARKPRDSTSAPCSAVATAEMVWEGTASSELRAACDKSGD
ncbi:hypothetical protein LTS16_009534 [Friedmanniomyces endolithicus]|nr:hypothetical protein LTR38_011254 [Friedmanniomyces endolithicus]KAK0814246.1 hypothetical protein LTR59_000783 [Friedmanniomyces endolithicus]KAK0820874.1 hypothetical protein LTR75_001193 [Friedmanniomyces endolithicus]KAK0845530.1 hypothetical protein LTR03_007420 [Friedmanniomyces endolithicus]KAK1001621.1 hypothetical protein LTS01_004528 [Friedmanniomyces endolithicus]